MMEGEKGCAAAGAQEGSEQEVSGPAFTCRYTAALRHVETQCVPNPVLVDHLAPHLCGPKGLQLAQKELQQLVTAQGPGKHLRVPARTRLLDDLLLQAIQQLTLEGQPGTVQVVSLGCGMDTRPWRLTSLPSCVACVVLAHIRSDLALGLLGCRFDVDMPEIAELKQATLMAAGAQTAASDNPGCTPAFPLLCGSYCMSGADLSCTSLAAVLSVAGFDPRTPTIWLLEALIYYMPLDAADTLLAAMATLSPPSSRLLLTCIDQELLEASQTQLPQSSRGEALSGSNGSSEEGTTPVGPRMEPSHIFADLWFFHMDELLASLGYKSWATLQGPASSKHLAASRLHADTYVALYGGAECIVVASRRDELVP
ncbi:hypothetical protein QJQ45_017988 [Haematococcus lacustris]|nr:hypothetical protein QJQ45_017988 [Haematococcus lacustris]